MELLEDETVRFRLKGEYGTVPFRASRFLVIADTTPAGTPV
jgi:hypothetical protein